MLPVERVLEEFDDLQDSYDFLEMFWFPFSMTMAVYMMDRTGAPPDAASWWRRLETRATALIQGYSAQKMIPWIARHAPQATPILNAAATKVGFRPGFNVQLASAAFHFQHAYAKCWEMEYAVPSESASEVWKHGMDLVNHYAKAGLYPINLTLHGRFTGPSKGWLAPNFEQDSCFIDLTTALGTPHWQSFFREMETLWCEIEGARPHWGKIFFQKERIARQYSMLRPFLEVRRRWDPKGIFMNGYLEELFGLRPPGSVGDSDDRFELSPGPSKPPKG